MTHQCSFTVEIEAAVATDVYKAPGFRYRFLNGSSIQTSRIGSSPGWTAVPHDDTSVTSFTRFRSEQSFPDIAISPAFLLALDDDPLVSFFLFDHPVLAAASGTKSSDAKSIKPSASTAIPSPAQAFTGLYEIDLSPFLANALHVKQEWRPPPQTSDLLHDNVAPSLSFSSFNLCSFPSASGLLYLSIQVTINQPLLTNDLLHMFNPLTITIDTARRLPGAVSSETATSCPHTLLQQYCKPVFAVIHFYPDQLSLKSETSEFHVPRLLRTPGKLQSAFIRWNSSATLLAGRFNQFELLDTLRFASLRVEIHDRDLKHEQELVQLQLKWEALYTTGRVPNQEETTDKPVDTNGAPLKPMELSAVDEIAKRDWRTLIANSSREFSSGLATYRLTELVDMATQRKEDRDKSTSSPMILKLTTDLIATKQRVNGQNMATKSQHSDLVSIRDSISLEKARFEPGAYISTGASLSIQVALQFPIHLTSENENQAETLLKPTNGLLFSRVVLITSSQDVAALADVTKAMTSINMKALPHVSSSSLSLYQLTEKEKEECEHGDVDIITGIEISDTEVRMFILEGLTDQGMMKLYEQLKLKERQEYQLAWNPDIRFFRRLYTAFELDLKRIKLHVPLSSLLTRSEIYIRSKVSANCYQALVRLAEMRKTQCLLDLKQFELFPTAQMLLEVDNQYGQLLTRDDQHDRNESVASKAPESAGNETKATKSRQNRHKAPTDSTNERYQLSRQNRIATNFILDRKKQTKLFQEEYRRKKKKQEEEDVKQGQETVYLYSGQKLRTQDMLQEQQRERLSKDRDAAYTYSLDFQSLALNLINPETQKQSEERENRTKWTTQRGFLYPFAREAAKAPSEARREELKQPFRDNLKSPLPVSRSVTDTCSGPPFSTLPSKDMVFGGTNADGSRNPQYFKSIHLCGEGLRLEKEEALMKEKSEWARRLVVDKHQLKFLAHGNICSQARTKPSQLDKLSDILKAPTASKSLSIIQNATLPSGKRVPLEKTPVTIQNQDEYPGNVAATFAKTLRFSDIRATNDKDFLLSTKTNNVLTPSRKTFVTRKAIVPVSETEKRGLIWRNE